MHTVSDEELSDMVVEAIKLACDCSTLINLYGIHNEAFKTEFQKLEELKKEIHRLYEERKSSFFQ